MNKKAGAPGGPSAFAESGYLSACRAAAIFSVICAHCCYQVPSFGAANRIATDAMLVFSKFGVAVFFVISGYLFGYNRRNIRDFTVRKLSSLVIPWLFTGSAVYLYVCLHKGGFSLTSYCQWLAGEGSYLWYMTVLLLLYYIFLVFRGVWCFPYIAVLLSAVSYAAAGMGLLRLQAQYLNVCNWMWLFAAGLLMNRYAMLEKIRAAARRYIGLTALAAAVAMALTVWAGLHFNYWSLYYIPYVLIFVPFVLGLAAYVQHCAVVRRIGEMSFPIYLLHMPVAGIVANLLSRFDLWLTTPLRPLIVLAITVPAIRLYTVIMSRLRLERIGRILIGGR